jgi:hypothetical protein
MGYEWDWLDSDPLPLKWVSLPPAKDRRGEPPEVAILNQATEYIEIAVRSTSDLRLVFDDNDRALFHRDTSSVNGTWRVELAVGGDNCAFERHTIEFTVGGTDNYFTAVSLSCPPSSSRNLGLLSLLTPTKLDETDRQVGEDAPSAPEDDPDSR